MIDSYASAIIDKEDFEPKIKNLKLKLRQIEEQIEKSVNTESAQYELFLVIDQLEKFSKKVDVTLDTVDFKTQREIIRALVKRVEIYKNEVVVVFRIDPEAPASNEASRKSSKPGGSIMHSCNRRKWATLCTPSPTLEQLLAIHDAGAQIESPRMFRRLVYLSQAKACVDAGSVVVYTSSFFGCGL